jgi:hypothetical protein
MGEVSKQKITTMKSLRSNRHCERDVRLRRRDQNDQVQNSQKYVHRRGMVLSSSRTMDRQVDQAIIVGMRKVLQLFGTHGSPTPVSSSSELASSFKWARTSVRASALRCWGRAQGPTAGTISHWSNTAQENGIGAEFGKQEEDFSVLRCASGFQACVLPIYGFTVVGLLP